MIEIKSKEIKNLFIFFKVLLLHDYKSNLKLECKLYRMHTPSISRDYNAKKSSVPKNSVRHLGTNHLSSDL